MSILRSLGLNVSEAEGKEYIWTTVGTFSMKEHHKVKIKWEGDESPYQSARAEGCLSYSTPIERRPF